MESPNSTIISQLNSTGPLFELPKKKETIQTRSLVFEPPTNTRDYQRRMQQTSSRFSCLHNAKKLQNALLEIRRWCLDYKESNGINWTNINQELTLKQRVIFDQLDASRDINSRLETAELIKVKLDFWKQRAKSRCDMYGDQSTSFFLQERQVEINP